MTEREKGLATLVGGVQCLIKISLQLHGVVRRVLIEKERNNLRNPGDLLGFCNIRLNRNEGIAGKWLFSCPFHLHCLVFISHCIFLFISFIVFAIFFCYSLQSVSLSAKWNKIIIISIFMSILGVFKCFSTSVYMIKSSVLMPYCVHLFLMQFFFFLFRENGKICRKFVYSCL